MPSKMALYPVVAPTLPKKDMSHIPGDEKTAAFETRRTQNLL